MLLGKERALFTLKVRWVYHRRGLSSIAAKLIEGCPGELCQGIQRRLVNLSFKPIAVNGQLIRWGGLVFLLFLLWSPWNAPKGLEVVMIDVGQ